MENYFQAEAFNLDKVLDEFEQNEGLWAQLHTHQHDQGSLDGFILVYYYYYSNFHISVFKSKNIPLGFEDVKSERWSF